MARRCPAIILITLLLPLTQAGLTVRSVIPGGAAEAAGLQAGDRFVSLDGREVSNMDDLSAVKGASKRRQLRRQTETKVLRGRETDAG